MKRTAQPIQESKEPRDVSDFSVERERSLNVVSTLHRRSQFEGYPKGNKKSHSKVTLANSMINTKKELVIRTKLNNPTISLKEIAKKCSASYGYARRVWSKYVRRSVTDKGSPLDALNPVLPFRVQNNVFKQEFENHFFDACPVEVSANRNGQKVYTCSLFSFAIWNSGKILVYPHGAGWKEALRRWLQTWMDSGRVDMLLDYLYSISGRHYCASAPGVPTGFRLRIKGLGTFTSDKTPFREGTIEYEVDPGFVGRLERLERNQIEIRRLLKELLFRLKNWNLNR